MTSSNRRVCPVAVVRLRLRFEESVGAVPAAILPPGWTDQETAGGPDAWRQMQAGPFTAIGRVYPTEVSWTCSPPRMASQVDVRVPWGVLPIDPRTLRAVGVEVFADAVTPDARQRWQEQGVEPFELTRDRLRFMGTVDRSRISIKNQEVQLPGRCFTGLLLDARLQPAAAQAVNLLAPIDEIVKQIVDSSPSTYGMEVVWLGAAPAPTLEEVGIANTRKVALTGAPAAASSGLRSTAKIVFGSALAAAAEGAKRWLNTHPLESIAYEASEIVGGTPKAPGKWFIPERPPLGRRAAPRAARRGAGGYSGPTTTQTVPYLPVEDDTSIWDAITDITVQCGVVAWVRFDKVCLAPARNVFGGARRRRFVLARNCRDLSFERNLGRRNIPAVEVRCWDSENRRRLIARYPTDVEQPTSRVSTKPKDINQFAKTPTDRRRSDEDIVRVVQGITSQEDLDEVAEGIYLELRRHQLAGDLQTSAMGELDSDGKRTLLDLISGDVLDVQPALAAWDSGDLWGMPAGTVRRKLEAAGISSRVATALGQAAEAGRLTTFWTTEAAHRVSTKNGYTLGVRFAELPTLAAPTAGRDEVLVERRRATGVSGP